MAIKTISQFPSGIPADNDYILFEQNGEGKSTTIGDAVNTCSLTYEEIMATNPVPDLSGKMASASALKELGGTDWVRVSEYIRCKKIGNVKFVQVRAISGNQQSWINIGTLPAEYRPLEGVKSTFTTDSSLNGLGTCMIDASGLVREWCFNYDITESAEYNINFMYM